MIVTNGKRYFITCGESCMVLDSSDGVLRLLYFGYRVEPEDDLSALVNGAPEFIKIKTGGKLEKTEVKSAVTVKADALERLSEPQKSLLFTVEAAGAEFELLLTPYERGGIAVSLACKSPSLKADAELKIAHEPVSIVAECGGAPFYAFGTESETRGDAYGAIIIDGKKAQNGGVIIGAQKDGRVLRALFVHSERGLGGMTRIFHDIIREITPEIPQAVTVDSGLGLDNVKTTVENACKLGADTLIFNGDGVRQTEIKAAAELCAERGMRLGLRVSAKDIDECAKLGATYFVTSDITPPRHDCTIERTAADAFFLPFGLQTTGNARADFERLYELSLFVPPWGMTCYIKPSGEPLKTQFDCAGGARLGYALNPNVLTEELTRAVRAQIFAYQDDARLIKNSDVYRLQSDDKIMLMTVSKDKSKARAAVYVKSGGGSIKFFGLDEHNLYRVREIGKIFSGSALVRLGIPAPSEPCSYCYHLQQVADYE